ncbi:uncharacterized protein DNG_02048 [Cephalotrichum gorgonifer]|uniref:DUF6590 domain-containing protein n=1 Tax=Cephalotrichum gorgonifer TaxID=2041049 RepID=A0AAE8MUG9_9PEZI|nr:uncharacterized protein DNG_02048 [Cephalotrichum gorgonifer]
MRKPHGERELPIGTIIMAPWHTPALDPDPNHPDRTETTHGSVISKLRPLIVIGHWMDHADCMAMYTHGGSGIAKLGRKQKTEYTQVRSRPANTTGDKDNILTVSRDHDGWTAFNREDSYVKTTEIVPHYYAAERSSEECGRMEDKSPEEMEGPVSLF